MSALMNQALHSTFGRPQCISSPWKLHLQVPSRLSLIGRPRFLLVAVCIPVDCSLHSRCPSQHLATRVYLRDMILAAAGVREKDFVLRKVLPRYAFLPEPARDPEALLGKIHCNDSLAASLQVAELSNSMATRVASNAQYFQHLPVAIRDIYLASYIESVVYRVVGIERTYTFLHRCLDFS
eukprot:m.101771 g.101771  ORF g.101771 m.101771 type:complete len:181 (-) comp8976_c0_seq3:88-630(-)